MRFMLIQILMLLLGSVPATAAPQVATSPSAPLLVVTSIKPLQLLVAAIGGEHVETRALLPSNASAHHYSLRMSDMRLLKKADLVFWLGSDFERYLDAPLADNEAAQTLTPTLTPHQTNPALVSKPNATKQLRQHDPDGNHHHLSNPHYWLDPQLALQMAQQIGDKLALTDPSHRDHYLSNVDRFRQAIEKLHREIEERLKPLRHRGFISLHDAYHHYVVRYGLNQLGALAPSSEVHKGVKHLKALNTLMASGQVHCLLLEPHYDLQVFRGIIEGNKPITTATLDPLAREISISRQGYIEFIQGLTSDLAGCLAPNK